MIWSFLVKKRLHTFFKNDDGVAAVEFALISSLFLSFLIGVYISGMYFFTWNRLQYGTEIAARYAAVHEDASESELVDIIAESMEIISINEENMLVTVSDTSANGIDFKQVDSSYQYTWTLPFMPESLNNVTLSASSRMAVR